MTEPDEIVRTVRIDAPVDRGVGLLTDPVPLRSWMAMREFEAVVGGRLTHEVGEWVAKSRVAEVNPPTRLVCTRDRENEPMGVDTTVGFVPDGDGTVVRLRHTGFPQPDWVDSPARGWDHVRPRLVVVGAGGELGPADVLTAIFGAPA